ncbi:acyltransferase [Sphingomonas gei]|uniref:Acyltransferase n=1 Tax=Sphingomonas gei TaxID=1395960 RepID=A0A4S1XDX6_9SPHN|nr:acyltransferase [Sphingomonas gei]TGX54095.1 acyltransferase [Sphingomonas gei]
MKPAAELRALTSLRGIAAWAVVLFHIRHSIGLPGGAMRLVAHGYLAVDFFFLLSGVVIWMTWHGRLAGGWQQVPGFLRKRIARIWPLHATMLAYAGLLALLFWLRGRPDPHFPFAEFPAHLLLVQAWGLGAETLSWNDPAWSISTELFAYLVFPLLVMCVDWRRWSSAALIGMIAVLLLGLAAIWHVRGVPDLGDFIPQMGLIRCVVEFVTGTIVGALWWRWQVRPLLPAIGAALTALAVAAAFHAGALPQPFAVPAIFAGALLGFALTSGMRGNPLDLRPLHYLGEISFATYLSHSLLWKTFKLALVSDPQAVAWPLIALYLLLLLGASVALYHGVERPAQRWINRFRLSPAALPAPRSPRG